MSQRTKQRRPTQIPAEGNLTARVEKALREGRSQTALDLAKKLVAEEASAPHKQLLFEAHMLRAGDLRRQGQTRDAATILGNAIGLVEQLPARAERVAQEYAACGQAQAALRLLPADSPVRARVLAQAADAALQTGAPGRAALSEELQPIFDLVIRAFEQLQAGQDDAVRETLQGIGLQSPFLEWRVFIRGLQAYYLHDDARALENWKRLSMERLPQRLAAPFRFSIDPDYRAAQPPETQAALQKHRDRLQGSILTPLLRPIQAALAAEDTETALSLSGSLRPHLKDQGADLERRVAAIFYYAIARAGTPKDLQRYRKVFAAPADDPECTRLAALASENDDAPDAAHSYWQTYEKWVAAHPEVWGGQAQRVRALIWQHMASNAAEAMPPEALRQLPGFVRELAAQVKPLQPAADVCFRKSIELAADILETHLELLDYHIGRNETDLADAAARALLERFPDNVSTLTYLGSRCALLKQAEEAIVLLERAYRLNPLERRMRDRLAYARLVLARKHLEAKRFEGARVEYQTAVELLEGNRRILPLCQSAMCEFVAAQPAQAEELLGRAREQAGHALPCAFAMLVESIRSKLSRPLKKRFEEEFAAALADTPQWPAVLLSLEILTSYAQADIEYRGRKAHETRILDCLKRLSKTDADEAYLERACASLLGLKKFKEVRAYTESGSRRFPHSPFFIFWEAESYIAGDPEKAQRDHRVPGLLRRARSLANQLPPGQRRDELLPKIEALAKMVQAATLFGDPENMMDALRFMMDGEDDDEDWDDDD